MWARVEGAISQPLDDEELVLAPTASDALHLNPTAAVVWELLEVPHTLPELTGSVLEMYSGDPHRVAEDIRTLVELLEEAGVLRRLA